MSDLFAPTLILNKGCAPIHVKPMADAICDVVADVADAVEYQKVMLNGEPNPFYYHMYSYKQWSEIRVMSKTDGMHYADLAPVFNKDPKWNWPLDMPVLIPVKRVILGVRNVVRGPFVLRHKEYVGLPDLDIRLTKKNLLLRDGFKCQYCGCKVSAATGTLDHVKPRAQKGGNSWSNLVIACFDCNIRKGSRTPEQAGMKLIGWLVPGPDGKMVMSYTPSKPKWYPLLSRFSQTTYEEWDDFLPAQAKVRPLPADAPVPGVTKTA